jgi:hypothetical protein
MRYEKNLDAGFADRGKNKPQIVKQPDILGDAFYHRPELPPSDRKSL